MMRVERRLIGVLAAGFTLVALSLAAPAAAQESGSSGGRAKVLVAPIEQGTGVKRNFGRKVSEEVLKRLGDLGTLSPIEERAVKDELSKLKLKEEDLGLVQWRQLAGRLDADLVLHGTVERASTGNAFTVQFVDARTGDATPIPKFAVQDDGGKGVDEAADRIMGAIEGQVGYQRSLLFCNDYLSAEQYDDARRNCEQALAFNPNSTTGRYLMGRVYMGMEDWEQARDNLQIVVERNPAEVDALNSLAFVSAQLGDMDRAMELYGEYLNFNPGDADVRMNIAFQLASAGGYDEAIGLLQSGIEVDPTHAGLWEFLGNVALNKGTTAGTDTGGTGAIADKEAILLAVEAYNKVLDLKGADTDPQILKNVVAAYLEVGDYAAALTFADRAEVQLPGDAGLRSLRADVHARMGDYSAAAAAMDEALRLDPTLERGLTKRGFFKLSGGDTDGAIADLRAAVEGGEDPNIVAAQMLSRGYNDHYKAGQYNRAINLFKVGTEFAQPGETRQQLYFFTAFSHYQLGVQIDQANERDEACQPARRALAEFEQVLPSLNRAGRIQAESQAQIRESTDVYLYREQQIVRKACR
ncbi:MAG: tetratricopeptide repeat protein [Gemmatimonadota bacterium]|nr:tetratricopeptide repeat protein [Gemmatimonadota bacterium]MDH3426803.1 tetratricopeptide repeat protein [Gemmatimonadota bacterium]